jgi:Holliday junction DNA helicase RuvA
VIGSLRGQLDAHLADGSSIVDVHGVGYRVHLSARARSATSTGGAVALAVHTHVRDDAIVLYGFADARERDCFEALLCAPGVGPALAQAILATLSPDGLATALATDDVDALCAVPGVGKKTAARLLLELQGRLALQAPVTRDSADLEVRHEVRGALSELGYTSEEVRRALEQLEGTDSVEDALRQALRSLSRR